MRSASASLVAACAIVAAACTVTSPRPLPPRRTQFTQAPPAPLPPAPDIAKPTQPPIRHERYWAWMVAADVLATIPLTVWMVQPEDIYLPAPSLVVPPLIHAAHGETGAAGISLLMRTAMVGGVYLAGRFAERECEDQFLCLPVGSIMLANLSIVPVVVLDALLLARTTKEDSSWRRLPLIPSVQTGPGGRVSLTLGKQF